MRGTRHRTEPKCGQCGGMHDTHPTRELTRKGDTLGRSCPHCGEFYELDADDPNDIDRHPAVPEDDPLDCICPNCNGSFSLRV